MLQYNTEFVWSKDRSKMYIFYKYNHGIGYIPTDIHLVQYGKTYSTPRLMELFVEACKKPSVKLYFRPQHWNDLRSGRFNKELFINLSKSMNKYCK